MNRIESKIIVTVILLLPLIISLILVLSSCISSDSKVTVTDPNGNCLTFTKDQVRVNIKQLEKDGYKVDIESTINTDD